MDNLQLSILGNHYEKFIAEQINSGKYASVYEVLKSALHLLENRENDLGKLQFLLNEGEDSETIDNFEPELFLDEIKAKYGAI